MTDLFDLTGMLAEVRRQREALGRAEAAIEQLIELKQGIAAPRKPVKRASRLTEEGRERLAASARKRWRAAKRSGKVTL